MFIVLGQILKPSTRAPIVPCGSHEKINDVGDFRFAVRLLKALTEWVWSGAKVENSIRNTQWSEVWVCIQIIFIRGKQTNKQNRVM